MNLGNQSHSLRAGRVIRKPEEGRQLLDPGGKAAEVLLFEPRWFWDTGRKGRD